MGLQELVESTEKLSDSLLVIKTTNGFYVGVEKFDGEKIRFHSFQGQDLTGPWDTHHVGQPEKDFSRDAGQMLREYAMLKPDSFSEVKSAIKVLYDSILKPLEAEPVIKNTGYKMLWGQILMSALSPFARAYLKVGGARAMSHSKAMWLGAAALSPRMISYAWRESNQDYVAGLRIKNPEVLTEDPSGENKVGIRTYGDFNPSQFGDRSSAESGKSYLRVAFRDGLELNDNMIWRPHTRDLYGECTYFLRVKPGTHKKLLENHAMEKARWEEYRALGQMLTQESVHGVCKTIGFMK